MVGTGYIFSIRGWRRCQALVCTMAGARFNLVALRIATGVLIGAVLFLPLPEATSALFTPALISAANQPEPFEAQGTSMAIDLHNHTVTIDHDEIRGLMSPMPKAFPVQPPEILSGITARDRVTFRLHRAPDTLTIVNLVKAAVTAEETVVLHVEAMT